MKIRKQTDGATAVIFRHPDTAAEYREPVPPEDDRRSCREYAAAKGYDLLETFDDEGSPAMLPNGPGFRSMLSFLRAQAGGTVVIVPSIISLTGDTKAFSEFKKLIAGVGGRLESPAFLYR